MASTPKHFAFRAEHISYNQAVKLFKDLQEKYHLVAAGMDQTFSDHIYMVARCNESDALAIQKKVHSINHGNHCGFHELSTEEVDTMM